MEQVDIIVTQAQINDVVDELKTLSVKWAARLSKRMKCSKTKVYGIIHGSVKDNESKVNFIYYGRKLASEMRHEMLQKLTA